MSVETVVRLTPKWMNLPKEVIWESVNKQWSIERSGTIDEPIYRVVGNGKIFPFSYKELFKLKSRSIPKYVKKVIEDDPTRENIQVVRVIYTKQFSWLAVVRFENSPYSYTYGVYTPKPINCNSIYYFYNKPFYSLEETSHPEIENMKTFCNSLIQEAFPEETNVSTGPQ